MFARWPNARMNAAEKALRAGRLDDACTAALDPSLGDHPRRERLLDELVRPLVARARLHRQAGRLREAEADLALLAQWGRATPEAQDLRRQVEAERRVAEQLGTERAAAAQRVAEQLAAGRLESGRVDLEQVPDAAERERLERELGRRVERGEERLAQAGTALEQADPLAAVTYWREACERHGRSRETDTFATARLAPALRRQVEIWLAAGRLDKVVAARGALVAVQAVVPSVEDELRAVAWCERAAGELAAHALVELRQSLLRIKAAVPGAPWVDGVLAALTQLGAAQDALLASPLGLLGMPIGEGGQVAARAAHSMTVRVPRVAGVEEAGAVRLDEPLLVMVDGGASGLLVTGERVRLGRGGSSTHVEVALPGDLLPHHADVTRHGEDYFLTAYGPVEVNRQPVQRALLRDGDRVVLGGRAKFVFAKPSARSDSAVLKLSQRVRLPLDVSEVVLFDETCLLGGGPSCHLRTREGEGAVVLFTNAGRLLARKSGGGTAVPVPADAALELGGVRMVIKPYPAAVRAAGLGFPA